MSTIKNLFQEALLAEATYANFAAFPNDPVAALKAEGITKGVSIDLFPQPTHSPTKPKPRL